MNRPFARLVPPLVTLALLALLVRQLPPGGFGRLLAGTSPPWLMAGVGLYGLVNAVRSVRYCVLLRSPAATPLRFMPVAFAVSLLNNVLPLRGGELSFVLLARAHYAVSAAQGTAALGLARLFDYLAVAALFVPLAALSLDRLPPVTHWPAPDLPTTWLVAGVAAFVLLGALAALSLAGMGRRAVALLRWSLGRLGSGDGPLARRALSFADRTVDMLGVLRTGRTYAATLGLSIVLWGLTFAWLYAFARGLGREASLGAFIVGATFAVLSKALPLPTVGGLGVAEAGWTLGFTLVGWTAEEAIASGLAVSALTLLVSAAFGLPALALLGLPRPDRAVVGER